MTLYPEESDLQRIADWPVPSERQSLVEFVLKEWDKGMGRTITRGNTLTLITGGWSGNEDIIAALQRNLMFWALYWEKSERGGRYTFEFME
jgi:hypothetical protein